ncbi:GvpL/GvpF family gas vesicle protein [Dactylosporangium sucinum]|uniref:Gas vesicle protein n=1 Tax=Dactylosporangium sucinum TaxID=1424081 RepID=A0A917TY73_9ACTN|nr:GvpL/GvpF family gas vesicle protein [Dactylosporangium sucinum]GGM44535.1 gas vesicle protein [Dactylosporangium sucinum]
MVTATTGTYVYGIVPADVETEPDARGVGGETAPVTVVRHGRVAALVSDVELDRPLGTPEDLLAHEQLLDATAGVVPVVPVRFGAVLTDRRSIVDDFLAPHHDEFDAALRRLDGKAEYVVTARYVEDAVLREVMAENPRLEQLRAAVRDRPEEVTRSERIELGQAVGEAIEVRRGADSQAVVDALAPVTVATVPRDPAGEFDAANVAVLAETRREEKLVRAVQELARRWAGRVEVRLLGPLAPYDFVDRGPEAELWDSSAQS